MAKVEKLKQFCISVFATEDFHHTRQKFVAYCKLQGKSSSQVIVDFIVNTAKNFEVK